MARKNSPSAPRWPNIEVNATTPNRSNVLDEGAQHDRNISSLNPRHPLPIGNSLAIAQSICAQAERRVSLCL
jgi:hypothetical protein